MATENVPVYNQYIGNGLATRFSIGFPYLDRDYVKVYIKRVSGVEEELTDDRYEFENDTTIVFPLSDDDDLLQDGDILTIQRETELGSDFEFDNQRRLFPEEVMNADDLSFQQIQELKRELDRSVKSQATDTITGQELYESLQQQYRDVETKVGLAASSANMAQTWAEQSATSASNASTSETNAGLSATSASNSASAATTQAEIATTQADEASTSATNASNSESNALTYSNNASNSATSAGDSATIAITQAGIATTQAGLSKQWAIGEPTEPSEGSAKYWAEQASRTLPNDGQLDIQVNGSSIATFTANQATNTTANIVVPDSATWGNITGTLSNQTDLQTALDGKQDKLTAGNGIDITDNKISTNTQFVITEDMFDIEYDATKGVAPYSTSDGYTNVTIHDDAGVEWVEGAIYSFVLDTKVAKSANRNVRVRIGEEGDWKPVMVASDIAVGSTVFVKEINNIFFYKTTYQENGALHCFYDTNTIYNINYSIDAGKKKAGIGTYAVTRFSIIMQKPDMTWEKITDTSQNYSTETSKTVNTRGFLLNQIRYYNYTAAYANGAMMSALYMYEKAANANGSYSFNCGTAPNWAIGDYIYLVGTVKDDGLFYLDTTKWWDNKLPTTNDGKLYIQLGIALTTTDSTFSFYSDRPIYYHDGTEIKQYIVHDSTKQDKLTAGKNITIENNVISSAGGGGVTTIIYDATTKTLIWS